MKLFKTVFLWALLLAVIPAGAASAWLVWALLMTRAPVDPAHAGITVEQLTEELLVLRLELSDVIVTRIDGYTGGAHAALLVKGDVSVGVDLAQAHFESIDENRRTATLVLPQPTASGSRVDHERSRIVALDETGLWKVLPGNRALPAVVNKAMAEAQAALTAAASANNLRERARRHSEAVLASFCSSLGWRIKVVWDTRDLNLNHPLE